MWLSVCLGQSQLSIHCQDFPHPHSLPLICPFLAWPWVGEWGNWRAKSRKLGFLGNAGMFHYARETYCPLCPIRGQLTGNCNQGERSGKCLEVRGEVGRRLSIPLSYIPLAPLSALTLWTPAVASHCSSWSQIAQSYYPEGEHTGEKDQLSPKPFLPLSLTFPSQIPVWAYLPQLWESPHRGWVELSPLILQSRRYPGPPLPSSSPQCPPEEKEKTIWGQAPSAYQARHLVGRRDWSRGQTELGWAWPPWEGTVILLSFLLYTLKDKQSGRRGGKGRCKQIPEWCSHAMRQKDIKILSGKYFSHIHRTFCKKFCYFTNPYHKPRKYVVPKLRKKIKFQKGYLPKPTFKSHFPLLPSSNWLLGWQHSCT